MNPLHVDGADPRRAANCTSGSTPQPTAAARARATQLAAAFSAQIEQSMMDSLAGLAVDDSQDGADPGLGSAAQHMAGAGAEAKLAQALLAAYSAADPVAATSASQTAGVPPASVGSGDAHANALVVADVARQQGVDPVAAVAMMLVESGGNAGAVGDGGSSFGLFQLHQGGMLTAAGLSPDQAFDPRTNATVSLRSLAHEWRKGPGRSAGQIAAASQRPADPAVYADRVDATMERARALLAGS